MKTPDFDPLAEREVRNGVDELFPQRWSPRAMSGEVIEEDELAKMFEAARWAPSSYNGQPWRFLYARRDTGAWSTFFDLMVPFNRSWAKNAGALVVILARKRFEKNDKTSRTHAFDTGAAWMSLALQGSLMGLVVHGMEGFDYDRAADVLGVPDVYAVQAMCAIGRPAPVDVLDEETRKKETVSGRKNLEDIAFEGSFPAEHRDARS